LSGGRCPQFRRAGISFTETRSKKETNREGAEGTVRRLVRRSEKEAGISFRETHSEKEESREGPAI
jgi:hypothetical protein